MEASIQTAKLSASTMLKGRPLTFMGNDDQPPPNFDDYYYVGSDRLKKPKLQKRVSVSLTPDLIAYIKNFAPVSRFVSACVRAAPKELITYYQRKVSKERRDKTIQGKAIPFDLSLPAYTIYASIPKRLRSAFVRDCLRARPSLEHVTLTKDELQIMKSETEKRLKKKKKKED